MKLQNFLISKLKKSFLKVLILCNLISASAHPVAAQCFESDGITVKPSYYNIMIALDDAWVNDFFGGDLDAARMSAEAQIDNTLKELNAPGRPFAFFFKLSFKKIFFPTFVGGPDQLPGEASSLYASRIIEFYRAKYSCVPFDCLIYFTSVSGTDYSVGVNGVVVTPGQDAPSMAHEIGHTLGLIHLGTTCCQTTNTIMCSPPKSTAGFTPLNGACGADVSYVNTKVFTPAHCASLFGGNPEVVEDDFECPPTYSYALSVAQSNPNPVTNCKTDGDINTVSVTIFNGYPQEKEQNVRAFIGTSFASSIEFVEDPTLDFNCLKPQSSKTEFWITDPNCGDEKKLSICAGCSITVKFKVRYSGVLPLGTTEFPITVYIGDTPIKQVTLKVMPYKSIPPGNQTSTAFGPNPLLFNGTFVMNDASLQYNFGFNKKILFASGAGLEIANGVTVQMPHVVAEGCSTMWKGITVRKGGTLNMSMMSTIKDAQFAVNVQKGATANIQASTFENNNFAINTSVLGLGDYNLTVLGNTFRTSDEGLKPQYNGQSPAPGAIGFTGIYALDLLSVLNLDKDPTFGLRNEFSNLHYGILAENTDVKVRDAMFTNIIKEPRPANYPGPSFTGTAIYLKGKSVDILGNVNGCAPDPVVMENCNTGVNVVLGSIAVGCCEMGNMTNGIVAVGGANKAYNITWNNIGASERGISAYYQSGLPNQSNIDNNTVRMAGNANGVGIAIGGSEMFPQQEGSVYLNHVFVAEGSTGIQIGVANKIKVTQNNVHLLGNGTHFGIKVEAGDRNTLNCNSVLGSGGNNDGIFAIHASRASVLCNFTTGPTRGLHFEGMLAGKNKADIGANVMEDNSDAGLILGTDAVTGPQVHRGNKWDGTDAVAGIGADLHSKFTVDADENLDFIPDAWLPLSWFSNIPIPSASFECGFNGVCPIQPISSDYPLDIKIVKGQLGGTTYQAANQWLSQRRFYELVSEEGNPYPGNSDVSTFLSQAQSNGLSTYAYVQTGIRQLGAMSESARITAAANLLTLNNTCTGSASYQVNEKLVNQIFLQTIAVGNLSFSPTQITSLEGIAALCPLSGGEAVLRARAMLQLVQGTQIDYDDLSICGGGRSEENKQVIQSVRVFPNPTNGSITVEYPSITEPDSHFFLFNTLGQMVKDAVLPQGQNSIQLSLNELSGGVYWYIISGAPNSSGKLVINH